MEKDSLTDVANHTHNGLGSKRISMQNLLPLPVLAAAPTHVAENGAMAISDVAGTRKLHIYIAGTWYATTLT